MLAYDKLVVFTLQCNKLAFALADNKLELPRAAAKNILQKIYVAIFNQIINCVQSSETLKCLSNSDSKY